jgi:hypothetical protein
MVRRSGKPKSDHLGWLGFSLTMPDSLTPAASAAARTAGESAASFFFTS